MTALGPVTAAWTMVRPVSTAHQLAGGQVLARPGAGPEGGVVGQDDEQLGAVAGELAGVARIGRLPAGWRAHRAPVEQQRLRRSPGTLS